MQEFEVVSRVDKKAENQKEVLLMAIDFKEPTFIKVSAKKDVKDHTIIQSDGKNCFIGNEHIGEVLSVKKGSDVSVSTDYDIKYTGGYSLDGKTVYLDEHFPPILKIQGKEIDIRKTIGLHHELPEKWMADEDYEYPYAHEVATGIEKKYVESSGGVARSSIRDSQSPDSGPNPDRSMLLSGTYFSIYFHNIEPIYKSEAKHQ